MQSRGCYFFFFLLILSHSKTGNNCFATLLQYELNSDVVTFYHRRSNLSSNKRVSLDLLIFLPFLLPLPLNITLGLFSTKGNVLQLSTVPPWDMNFACASRCICLLAHTPEREWGPRKETSNNRLLLRNKFK